MLHAYHGPATVRKKATDPYWSSVVLMMNFTAANGSQTFVDESHVAHTVTALGTAAHTTTGPLSGSSSLLLDGSAGCAVRVDHSPYLRFGSEDFTIEFDVEFTDAPADSLVETILSKKSTGAAVATWVIVYRDGTPGAPGKLVMGIETAGTLTYDALLTSTTVFTAGVKRRVAIVNKMGNLQMYVEGVREAQVGWIGRAHNTTEHLIIGGNGQDVVTPFKGRLDRLRITKGVCRYMAPSYVPDWEPLPTGAPPGTEYPLADLLLHMDNSNGSVVIVDSSSRRRLIQNVGTPALSSAWSAFGPSSLRVQSATNAYGLVNMGPHFVLDSDFTIEGRARFLSSGTNMALLTLEAGTELYRRNASGNVLTLFQASTNRIIGTTTLANDTDYSWCWQRVGLVNYIYVDGVLQGSWTETAAIVYTPTNITIGAYAAGTDRMDGYLDELRITNGKALYPTAGYTVATQAFGGNTVLPLDLGTCELFLPLEGTNGGLASAAVDCSGRQRAISSVAGSTFSTAVAAQGSSSVLITAGSSSGFSAGIATDFAYLTATLESWWWGCYFRIVSATGVRSLLTKGSNSETRASPLLLTNATTLIADFYRSATFGTSGHLEIPGLAINTWYHAYQAFDAETRTMYLALDGQQMQSVVLADPASSFSGVNTTQLRVGRMSTNGAALNGYVDHVRVHRGTVPFKTAFDPQLLL